MPHLKPGGKKPPEGKNSIGINGSPSEQRQPLYDPTAVRRQGFHSLDNHRKDTDR
jgi:hypothetical protein